VHFIFINGTFVGYSADFDLIT